MPAGIRRTATRSSALLSARQLGNRARLSATSEDAIIPLSRCVYSQSSVYSGTSAATAANMTNGLLTDTATATNAGGVTQFVKFDMGRVYEIAKIVVGTATSSIPGGWNKSYTENCLVQVSFDDSYWITLFNTGTFASNGIYTFNTKGAGRYVRMVNALSLTEYVALGEFYALAPGQANP